MRQQWWLDNDATSKSTHLGILACVVFVHACAFWAMGLVHPALGGRSGDGTPIKVHVGSPVRPAPLPAPRKTGHRVESGRTSRPASPTAPRVAQRTPAPVAPEPEAVAEFPQDAVPSPDGVQTPSPPRSLSSLLPQSSGRYLEEQRRIGEETSTTHEDREVFVPRPELPTRVARPNTVTTEFSTLAYRMELEHRFAQAWGEVRSLPPGSRFMGIPGELIAYNVIINRDGSLRRIVNVSALEQAGRDYSDVDWLVRTFADSVFPMNPLPDRIRDDPFILRWTLRFVGNRWGLF